MKNHKNPPTHPTYTTIALQDNYSRVPSAQLPRHHFRIVIRSGAEGPRIPMLVKAMIKPHVLKIKNSMAA